MIKRDAEDAIHSLLRGFPIVTITGPRQSGKTTLAFIELLPFSLHELAQAGKQPSNIERMLFTGGYSSLYDRDVAVRSWVSAYVMAYIERDVRQVLKVQELETFHRFVRLWRSSGDNILNSLIPGSE